MDALRNKVLRRVEEWQILVLHTIFTKSKFVFQRNNKVKEQHIELLGDKLQDGKHIEKLM